MTIPKQLQNKDFRFVKIVPGTKRPVGLEWQKNVYTLTEIDEWIAAGNSYGVAGGHGGVIIIDPDSEAIKKICEEKLPRTFTVRTGSGRKHFYYFCPEIKAKIVFNDNVEPPQFLENETHHGEIISFGAQAVGPGSIHPDTGKKYEVLEDIEIAGATQEQIFLVFDEFLSPNFFTKKNYKKSEDGWKNTNSTDELDIFEVLRKFGISTEYRGQQLQTSHPIHGSEGGLNFAVSLKENAWFCFRHNSGGGPMNLIAVLEKIIDCSEAVPGGLRGERFMRVKDVAVAKYGLKELGLNVKTGNVSEKDKVAIYAQLKKDFFHVDEKTGKKKVSPFGIQKIAQYFVDNYHIKTMGGEKTREIYLYENGVYRPEGSSFFKAELEKILEEAWSNHWQTEIVEKIKNLSYVRREEFVVDKNLINLKNGIFDLRTKKLLPHDPVYLFLHQIPVNYDPSADCPKIKQFLNETFEEKDLTIIQEWLGFALYRDYFIKKALIIFGAGNTGKSTWVSVVTRFAGASNTSDVPLQKINDRFTSAGLYNKHLNICDDLSATDVSENGPFKMATGRSPMSGEYKYGDRFSFISYAKLTFCCNKIPAPTDTDDDAYFSRWILINLQKPITREKMDNSLLDKLLTDEELSGLLNFSLIGLNRLLVERNFSYKKEVYEVKTEMLKSSSSIAQFAYDCLEKEVGNFVSSERLYNAYVNYADEKGLATEIEDKFGKNLAKYVGYVVKRTGVEMVKQVRGWGNVKIKENPISNGQNVDNVF